MRKLTTSTQPSEKRPSHIDSTIINASYPRSGNTFLNNIVSNYFLDDFVLFKQHSNEIISSNNQHTIADVNYVKTHDFELKGRAQFIDSFSSPVKFLIQIRHPLESISSYYEFALHHGDIDTDSISNWNSFLFHRLEYWKSFCDRWTTGFENDEYLVVKYEDLYNNTFSISKKVIELMSSADKFSSDRLNRAINDVKFLQYAQETNTLKKAKRDITQFRFFDLSQFREIESSLSDTYLDRLGIESVL